MPATFMLRRNIFRYTSLHFFRDREAKARPAGQHGHLRGAPISAPRRPVASGACAYISESVPRQTYHSSSKARLMEVSSWQQQYLGDSFSYGWLKHQAPSFAADEGCSFGSSFIDMDDADLFSMRWTTTTPSDFDFGVMPLPGSPTQLASASRIFRRGRLLPSDPVGAVQEQNDLMGGIIPASSSPLFRSTQSAPASPSSTSRHATVRGGRQDVSSSAWKVAVLRYVRFLMPLYRKARALAAAPRHKHARVAPAAGSPGRVSAASVEWCHGSADTAVHDAILYCKKSSGQDALP